MTALDLISQVLELYRVCDVAMRLKTIMFGDGAAFLSGLPGFTWFIGLVVPVPTVSETWTLFK